MNKKIFNESLVRRVTKTTHKDLENLADELLDDSVDLGLSVRWCKCNLGADSPEEFGDYYGWGMTEPYKKGVDDVDWKLYNQFTASKIKTDLTDETDAATIKLGKRYRMPTKEEYQELIDNCDWKWTQMNGVDGYKVMNKRDHSKFIFLPAAGIIGGLSHYYVGSRGFYWSRSRKFKLYCYNLRFNLKHSNVSFYNNYNGFPIRPVKISKSKINESIFHKAKKNLNRTQEEIIKEYEEMKSRRLDFAIDFFLNSDLCRKAPKEISVPYRDNNGNIVKDEDGDIINVKKTVYSYNYNILLNALSKVLKKVRPESLPPRVSLKIKFESREQNLLGKNTIFLYKFPTGENVAKCSTLSDKDIENLMEDSIICTYWVKKLIMFYFQKKLGMDENEIAQCAEMFYHYTNYELDKELEMNESLVRRVMKTTHKDLENLADELLDDSVDLGLSVRWCKCNLGADNPWDSGDYYGWGMTEPYKEGVDVITKDFYKQFPASKIKTDLTDELDAATIKLGKHYRMPTEEECQELIDNCIWEWTQMNGVNGYKVMNKKDHSKFIFLPAAGYLNGLSHYYVGSEGFYWSRSRYSTDGGWRIGIYSGNCLMNVNCRFVGLSVRPVFNQSK